MPDILKILQQAQHMQGKLQQIQDDFANRTVTGAAGGGMVRVEADGKGMVRRVKIEPHRLNPADVDTLEGIERGAGDVLAAVRTRWPAITKVAVRAAGAVAAPMRARITHDTVKAENIAALRKRDPVLGAAIDALDFEPMD